MAITNTVPISTLANVVKNMFVNKSILSPKRLKIPKEYTIKLSIVPPVRSRLIK